MEGLPEAELCQWVEWFVLEDGPDYETDDDPETLVLYLQQFGAEDDSTTASQPSSKKRICVRHAAQSAAQQGVSSAAQPARNSASNVAASISDSASDSLQPFGSNSNMLAARQEQTEPAVATAVSNPAGEDAAPDQHGPTAPTERPVHGPEAPPAA